MAPNIRLNKMHSHATTGEERLITLLRLLFSSESKTLYECFGATFLRALVESSRDNYSSSSIVREEQPYFLGYPSGNLLRLLAQVLVMWSARGEFPVKFVAFGSETTPEVVSKLNSFSVQVTAVVSCLDDPQCLALLERLMMLFGPRGVLTCLGVRHTPGSVDKYCLPTRAALERAFGQSYTKEESKGSSLTVGARALAKHYHRSSEGFWGKLRGTEEIRNQQAVSIMNRLLNECVWVNLHCLPKDEAIVEIRVRDGYGARWYVQKQQSFRGFVEPMMEGGHDKRWRH
jgi:hypothetical protein